MRLKRTARKSTMSPPIAIPLPARIQARMDRARGRGISIDSLDTFHPNRWRRVSWTSVSRSELSRIISAREGSTPDTSLPSSSVTEPSTSAVSQKRQDPTIYQLFRSSVADLMRVRQGLILQELKPLAQQLQQANQSASGRQSGK